MAAFEHVTTLLSFVLALSLAHLLTCLVAMVRAGSRVRYSFAHSAWMLNSFMLTVASWLGFWDFRALKSWDVGTVVFSLATVILVYVYTGLVCPEIPEEGTADLDDFHRTHFRQYIAVNLASASLGIVYNVIYGAFFQIAEQYTQIAGAVPMLLIGSAAYIFPNRVAQNVCAAALLILWSVYFFDGQRALR